MNSEKIVMVSVRVSPEEKMMIDYLCKVEGKKRSTAIREILVNNAVKRGYLFVNYSPEKENAYDR